MHAYHIMIPPIIGGISFPVALYMNSPTATLAVITVTACSIFSALPNFWTIPSRFLTGAAAAAGIALINTLGNVAGFAARCATGGLRSLSGSDTLSMFVFGRLMLVSGSLTVVLNQHDHRLEEPADQVDAHELLT